LGIGSANGQLLTEHFEYGATNGDLTAVTSNWLQTFSGTPNLQYNAGGSLSFGSFPTLGGRVVFAASTQSAARTFSNVSSGTLYASFIVRITAAQATGNHFFTFINAATFRHGRVLARQAAGGFEFGLAKGGASTTNVFGTTVYSLNTDYFVVVKYNFGANATDVADDVADLFVFPTSVPVTEPGTSTIQATTGTGTLTELQRVEIRQGGATNAPSGEIDYIRVGTTWAEVTGTAATPTITVSTASLSGFSTPVGTPSAAQNYTVSGSNLTDDITIAAPPAGYEYKRSTDATYTTSPITLTQSGGNVPATTINVRLTGATAGTFTGNIAHTSTGATTQNVALNGTVSGVFSPIYEPFTGTGNLNGYNGWVRHSGTADQIQRVAGSLSYSGLQASTGDKIQILNTQSEDVNKALGSVIASGSVYASAIIRVTDASKFQANTENGEYFLHFADQAGATHTSPQYSTRLHIRQGSVANTFQLGILRMSGGTITATDIYGASPTNLSINTNYLVVIKYTFGTTPSASLFINPVPGNPEPTATHTTTAGTGTVTDIESICIRTSNTCTPSPCTPLGTGDVEIDELRVGITWADVTPAGAATPTITVSPSSLTSFSTPVGTPSAAQNYTVSGSNLTADITLAAPPAGYEFKRSTDATYTTSPITLTQSGGNVPATTINVRLTGATAGTFTGNIAHTSTGAITQNVALSGTTGSGPVLTPIADIRNAVTPAPNLVQTAPFAVGTDVVIQGQIYGVNRNVDATPGNGTSQRFEFTLIDNSPVRNGLVIRANGNNGTLAPTDLQEGDIVTVVGKVNQFRGLTQVGGNAVGDITSVTRISSGNPRKTPVVSTIIGEDEESNLIRLNNVSVNQGQWQATPTAAFNVDITVGANTYVMRITPGSELYGKTYAEVFGPTQPTTGIDLIGLGGQFGGTAAPFNTGYQFFVYRLADVIAPAPLVPELTTNAPTNGLDFGDVAKGAFSASQSYKLSGKDLPTTGSNTNTIVNAPNNFQVSKNNTDFASSVSFTNQEINNAGTAGLDVFVRFAPNSELDGLKGGDISNSVPATTPTLIANVAVRGRQLPPLSLMDELANQTQVYPNPANKTFQIKADRNYQVEMQDVTGRKVGQFTSNEAIYVENLPNGLYFLQFSNENIKFVKRLVIQK
jgi:hypothetical protein